MIDQAVYNIPVQNDVNPLPGTSILQACILSVLPLSGSRWMGSADILLALGVGRPTATTCVDLAGAGEVGTAWRGCARRS